MMMSSSARRIADIAKRIQDSGGKQVDRTSSRC
jgi:hypothetical protein